MTRSFRRPAGRRPSPPWPARSISPFFIDKNALPVMKSEHRISSLGHAIRAGFPGRRSGSSLRFRGRSGLRIWPGPHRRSLCRLRGGKPLRREPKTPRRGNLLLSPARFGTEIFRSNYWNFARVPSRIPSRPSPPPWGSRHGAGDPSGPDTDRLYSGDRI